MGKIVKVSGPLVVATGMEEANMADVVRVGEQRLIGEILNMNGIAVHVQNLAESGAARLPAPRRPCWHPSAPSPPPAGRRP